MENFEKTLKKKKTDLFHKFYGTLSKEQKLATIEQLEERIEELRK